MGPIISTVGVVMMATATPAYTALAGAVTAAASAGMQLLVAWGPWIALAAAIAIGIYELVKHWRGFVHGLEAAWFAAWHAIHAVFEAVWNFIKNHLMLLASIILGPFGAAIVFIAKHWETVWHGIEQVFGAVIANILTGLRMLLDVFMNVVGTIIHGAAAMFGWVPGVGGKLKAARDAFDSFHASVDNTLTSIAANAQGWGKNVANNYASGILTGKGAVAAAATAVATETQHRLRVSSPAKLGPLSTMGGPEGWGKRMIDSLASGMLSSLPRVRLAANTVAGAVALRGADGAAAGVPGAPIGSSSGAGGGDVYIEKVEIVVSGARDPRAVAIEVREEISKFVRNNGGRSGFGNS
jgi:hypothetical protein